MKPPFPAGTIDRFFPDTPYYFLSNFPPAAVSYEGLTFPTVEHGYQAAKSLDENVRKLILSEPSPAGAKRRGKSVALRPDWDLVKFDIMRELLLQKFSPGSSFQKRLAETGDVLLIEGNYWHDMVWGQCFCPRHKWAGANSLGNLLMELRAMITGTEAPNVGKRCSPSLIDTL